MVEPPDQGPNGAKFEKQHRAGQLNKWCASAKARVQHSSCNAGVVLAVPVKVVWVGVLVVLVVLLLPLRRPRPSDLRGARQP